MRITQIHAHFLISIGNYSNERIGFTVDVEDPSPQQIEETVQTLRERAIAIVGKPAAELYEEKFNLQRACNDLEKKLSQLREQWEKTAVFLRTQGLNTPSMPFEDLFTHALPASIEEELVETVDHEPDSNTRKRYSNF